MAKVVVYLRVSGRSQGEDDRLGLPSQEAAIQRYCQRHGHEIVKRYCDIGFSGATADRPQLARLLAAAPEKQFQAVVVYRGDRLARDMMLDGYLRYALKRHGVEVLSVTEKHATGEDPTAKLTQSVLAAVAEFERHLIRQRLSAARRLKKARGGYGDGRPRFGFRAAGGALVPHEDEQRTLRLMRRLRRRGESVRAIAKALNAGGYCPRHASAWGASTIHQVLTRRVRKPSRVDKLDFQHRVRRNG